VEAGRLRETQVSISEPYLNHQPSNRLNIPPLVRHFVIFGWMIEISSSRDTYFPGDIPKVQRANNTPEKLIVAIPMKKMN
jgi:hypothetical protein